MAKTNPRKHENTRSMHGTLLAVALLMIALLLAPPSNAQPRPVQPGGVDQDAPLVPEWVVPGARVTQFGASAQHTKRNRARDNRWREEDERARQRDIDAGLPMDEVERRARQREEQRASDRRLYQLGKATERFLQHDIVAVTAEGVLVETRGYLVPPLGGAPQLDAHIETRVVDHATGGGLWLRPDIIQNTPDSRGENGGPTVYRGSYAIGEHTFDAITFVVESGDTRLSRVYDRASGVQLYRGETTDTADIRSSGHAEFVGYRVAELPWLGTRFTQQVQGFRKITCSGTIVTVAPRLAPDIEATSGRLPDQRLGFDAEFAFEAVSAEVIRMETTITLNGPRGQNQANQRRDLVSPNARAGMYIDPAVLARLQAGDVLDEDPLIGYSIVVSRVYQVQGITLVEITEVGLNNSYTAVATYDASVGLQVQSVHDVPVTGKRYELEITGIE